MHFVLVNAAPNIGLHLLFKRKIFLSVTYGTVTCPGSVMLMPKSAIVTSAIYIVVEY